MNIEILVIMGFSFGMIAFCMWFCLTILKLFLGGTKTMGEESSIQSLVTPKPEEVAEFMQNYTGDDRFTTPTTMPFNRTHNNSAVEDQPDFPETDSTELIV